MLMNLFSYTTVSTECVPFYR